MTDLDWREQHQKRYFISYYDPINGYNDFFSFDNMLYFDDLEAAQAECETLNSTLGEIGQALKARFVVIDSTTGEEVIV